MFLNFISLIGLNRKFNSPPTPLFMEFQSFIFGVLWAPEPSSFSVQLIMPFLASSQTLRGEETTKGDKECLCRRLGAITYCFRGSPTGFSGSRIISLIWGLGFRILKQNRGEILDQSLCKRWDAKNNPWDHGIVRNLWARIMGLKSLIGDPHFTQVHHTFLSWSFPFYSCFSKHSP